MGVPDVRAYDMLEKIRKLKDSKNVPIIFHRQKDFQNRRTKDQQYADSIVIKTATFLSKNPG